MSKRFIVRFVCISMVVCSGISMGFFMSVDDTNGQVWWFINCLGIGVSFFLLFISLLQTMSIFARNTGAEKTYNISEHDNN